MVILFFLDSILDKYREKPVHYIIKMLEDEN